MQAFPPPDIKGLPFPSGRRQSFARESLSCDYVSARCGCGQRSAPRLYCTWYVLSLDKTTIFGWLPPTSSSLWQYLQGCPRQSTPLLVASATVAILQFFNRAPPFPAVEWYCFGTSRHSFIQLVLWSHQHACSRPSILVASCWQHASLSTSKVQCKGRGQEGVVNADWPERWPYSTAINLVSRCLSALESSWPGNGWSGASLSQDRGHWRQLHFDPWKIRTVREYSLPTVVGVL